MRARGSAGCWLPLIALTAIALLSGAGCSSSSSATSSQPARPTTTATLQILTPAPNAQTGPNVSVLMRLDHAEVVPAAQVGGAIRPDRGHIHLTLDGVLVAMPAVLQHRLTRMPPGSHTLVAEFVASDHVAFANRVVAAVTFRVR